MAKSSLQFLEKRNVDLYDSDSYAIRTLEKHDCGKVIVLSNARGHTLTLPPAATVGEGWNVRFVVGAVHSDRTVRDLTTIAAQGSETVTLTARKVGGSLDAGAKSKRADAIDTASNHNGGASLKAAAEVGADAAAKQANLTKENISITVPVAAGGTGTAFTFKFITLDASLPADNGPAPAGEFQISVENLTHETIQEEIVKCINGAAVTVASVRVPASGEGSEGTGISGLDAVEGTSNTQVDLEASKLGAAGDGITVAIVGGHAEAAADIIGSEDSVTLGNTTAGADRTGVSLDTRTIQITEGATAGDQVELAVVNGQWQATSLRAE